MELRPLASAVGSEGELFNGSDLSAWKQPTVTWGVVQSVVLAEANPKGFVATDGQGGY
jgi:hypothetical protein